MPIHRTKLIRSEEIAASTMAFHLERPVSLEFRAGQCLSVTLIDPPETDDKGNMRVFTIASAPYEREVMVATRIRDTAFKRALKAMVPGSELEIDGPYGDFSLHQDPSIPAVFLTGGIGVTPFLSMLRQAIKDESPLSFRLFFSNRTPEDAPFLEELESMADRLADYRFAPTMTRPEGAGRPWDGETGYISEEILKQYIHDLSRPIYYVVGPTGLALAMRRLLLKTGVRNERMRFEDFTGY